MLFLVNVSANVIVFHPVSNAENQFLMNISTNFMAFDVNMDVKMLLVINTSASLIVLIPCSMH